MLHYEHGNNYGNNDNLNYSRIFCLRNIRTYSKITSSNLKVAPSIVKVSCLHLHIEKSFRRDSSTLFLQIY